MFLLKCPFAAKVRCSKSSTVRASVAIVPERPIHPLHAKLDRLTPHSTFHIPHSTFHIPHSTFHITSASIASRATWVCAPLLARPLAAVHRPPSPLEPASCTQDAQYALAGSRGACSEYAPPDQDVKACWASGRTGTIDRPR